MHFETLPDTSAHFQNQALQGTFEHCRTHRCTSKTKRCTSVHCRTLLFTSMHFYAPQCTTGVCGEKPQRRPRAFALLLAVFHRSSSTHQNTGYKFGLNVGPAARIFLFVNSKYPVSAGNFKWHFLGAAASIFYLSIQRILYLLAIYMADFKFHLLSNVSILVYKFRQ